MTMANEYIATIDKTVEDGQLIVKPTANSPKQEILRYELISAKQGTSGKSLTSQSGNVRTKPDQPMILSTLKLGMNDTDHYTITLNVYADNILVASDKLQYP